MAPSGEACLVRDADTRVWISSIYAPITQVAGADVDQVIAEHDWNRVNRPFATWADLVAYRDANASAPLPRFPAIAEYDVAEIRDALQETETTRTVAERARARTLLTAILRNCPAARLDEGLHSDLVDRLAELSTSPRFALEPSDELVEALMRFSVAA
jgi:hypothetical protein